MTLSPVATVRRNAGEAGVSREASMLHPRGPTPARASPLEAALHLARSADGRWHLRSTRAEWAGPMLRGRPADHAPTLLPGLYALCAGAHRLAARHALAAARGAGAAAASEADAQALRLDTLREHLRRLWLDAPRWAGVDGRLAAAPPAAELARAPFMHAGANLADETNATATRRWVEAHVLQGDADAWVAAWHAGPATQALDWATTAHTWPARWLRTMQALLGSQAAPCRAVRAPATAADLQALADALRSQPSFALQPTEHGIPAETGCWTRVADLQRPHHPAAGAAPWPLWLRHAARIAEVARLVTAEGAGVLAQGRFSPAPPTGVPMAGAADPRTTSSSTDLTGLREGLGWCEMARGLLVHWVSLDADDRIARYRVIAPTEWNFHAEGAAARALVRCLETADDAPGMEAASVTPASGAGAGGVGMARLHAIAAAYDPCVELRLEDTMSEPADA